MNLATSSFDMIQLYTSKTSLTTPNPHLNQFLRFQFFDLTLKNLLAIPV